MTPLDFLKEELASVQRALKEILRYEYDSEVSAEFYREFSHRIGGLEGKVESANDGNSGAIQVASGGIRDVAARISLIERSHLGEFSWPFARTLQEIGASFEDGKDMEGPIAPLVHVIAEGAHYKIIHDTSAGVRRRPIPVVAFPRQLKHYVLLHALFGHEMGHLAFRTTGTASRIRAEVRPHIESGALQNASVMQAWLAGAESTKIRTQLVSRPNFRFKDKNHEDWVVELTSDLFGLVLFGPAFIAAHRMLLAPESADPYKLNLDGPTHPPYAVRRSVLIRAMKSLEWSIPTLASGKAGEREAEKAFLEFLCVDPFPEEKWVTDIVQDKALKQTLDGIAVICGEHAFVPLPRGHLSRLLERLSQSLPPVIEDFTEDDHVKLEPLSTTQVLSAGWMYWLGRSHLKSDRGLSFEEVNRLCDIALLQHRAIQLTREIRA